MPPVHNPGSQPSSNTLPQPQPVTVNAAVSQPTPAAPLAQQASVAAASISDQTKLLISQYKTNPYQLSLAIQQLKSKYLAEQFGIKSPGEKL